MVFMFLVILFANCLLFLFCFVEALFVDGLFIVYEPKVVDKSNAPLAGVGQAGLFVWGTNKVQ